MITKVFKSKIEAVDWIAQHVENEGQFEVAREAMTMDFIKSGKIIVKLDATNLEVVTLENNINQF